MAGIENDLQEQPNLKEIMSNEFDRNRILSGFKEAHNERWAQNFLELPHFQKTILNNEFWAKVPENNFELVDKYYFPVTNGYALAIQYGSKDCQFNKAAWHGPKFYLVTVVEYFDLNNVQVSRIIKEHTNSTGNMYISKPKTIHIGSLSPENFANEVYEVLERKYYADEERVLSSKS